MNGFEKIFAQMQTRTLQHWLRFAQQMLPSYPSDSAIHEMTCEGIKSAATELLNRYRQEIKNLA